MNGIQTFAIVVDTKGAIPMGDDISRRNHEHYMDLTAYDAIKKTSTEEEDRFRDMLDIVKSVCKLAGFRIENRIIFTDLKTNRVWK